MKIGICLLLLANDADPLSRYSIPAIARTGYDYAEISLARIYDLPDDEIIAYRKLFSDNGVNVEAFNNAVPAGFSIVGDDATVEIQNAYIARAIKLAEQFGVKVITTSGPNAKRVPEGFDWVNIGYIRYIDFMRRFAKECANHGISIALEPICSKERGFVNTTGQACQIISEIGCRNVTLLVDMFHFAQEHENVEQLPKYAASGLLTHLHAARLDNRMIPAKDYADTLRRQLLPLVEAGFDRRISIEAKPNGTSIDQVVSDGLATIKFAVTK